MLLRFEAAQNELFGFFVPNGSAELLQK